MWGRDFEDPGAAAGLYGAGGCFQPCCTAGLAGEGLMAAQRGLAPVAVQAAGDDGGQIPPYSRGKIRHIWRPGAARQRLGENGRGRRTGVLRDFQPARGSESKIPRRGGDSPSHRPGRPPAGGGAAGPSRARSEPGPAPSRAGLSLASRAPCVPCPCPVSRVPWPCPGPGRALAGRGGPVTRGPVISRLGGVSRDFPERRCLPAAPLPAQPPSLLPAGRRPAPRRHGRAVPARECGTDRIGPARGLSLPAPGPGAGQGTVPDPRVGWEVGVCACFRGGRVCVSLQGGH